MNILIQSHYRPEECDARVLNALARRAVGEALQVAEASDCVEVSLLFVEDSEMRELNRLHRGVDRPTDVLAFAMREGPGLALPPEEDEAQEPLGDIVVSLETALRQARRRGHTLRREVAVLLIHGALHLLGFDHAAQVETRKMRRVEKDCLSSLENLCIL